MEPLKIIEYPNNILSKKCASIERITDSEVKLFEDMLFTMRHFAGIGLAAPQVGVDRDLVVADIGEGAVRLANPVILKTKGSNKLEEGCLSIPGVGVVIDRPDEIIVSGLDEKGKVIELEARGLLARVLQHEIDHLKGKLIIDYVGLLEKMMLFKPKFKKAKDKYANL
ncbi:MAG: peptide deformylase [Candidatus Omnitrophota bacterium]|nr:peptide deformylase [Candidatus Omnitrophota bacterium]MBU1928790.1 peptide deformylase [Candidatus Omnitrophota bacterium]MBU2034249.1 peptide deformylase [Candidatus Omnitrophota bacterium]